MERDSRRDERRRPDNRDHKARYGALDPAQDRTWRKADSTPDRDRSRSPPQRERRDDRRRDRSPYRGPPRAGAPRRDDRDQRDFQRGRPTQPSSDAPLPPRRPGDRGPPPRQPYENRQSGVSFKGQAQKAQAPEVNMEGLEGEDEEATMARVMGFKDFRTTKNTKVPGNDKNYAVSKVKKAEYRQYMNRVGGFNRPLSPSRG